MSEYKWGKLKGKRLLLTDMITRIQRSEWTLLEISPNGKVGKFRNELADTCFWNDLDDLVVMDVLPPNKEIDTTLTAERDEARRIACTYVSGTYTKDVVSIDRTAAMAEAARRGWDCYKEAK